MCVIQRTCCPARSIPMASNLHMRVVAILCASLCVGLIHAALHLLPHHTQNSSQSRLSLLRPLQLSFMQKPLVSLQPAAITRTPRKGWHAGIPGQARRTTSATNQRGSGLQIRKHMRRPATCCHNEAVNIRCQSLLHYS